MLAGSLHGDAEAAELLALLAHEDRQQTVQNLWNRYAHGFSEEQRRAHGMPWLVLRKFADDLRALEEQRQKPQRRSYQSAGQFPRGWVTSARLRLPIF